MFPTHRIDKIGSERELRRRIRHLCSCLEYAGDDPKCPIHSDEHPDDGCSCNGTEALACHYCIRKHRHDPVPF